jgi:hypothetical protein
MGGYVPDDRHNGKRMSFMEGYRKIGSKKFWAIFLPVLAWIAVGIWLELRLHFPEDYGFTCTGKGCLYVEVWHSAVLLHQHPNLFEIVLFVWLWSWPVALVSALAYAIYRQLNPLNSDAE